MTKSLALQKVTIDNKEFDLAKLNRYTEAEVIQAFMRFIEVANTVTDRATHHESKDSVVNSAKDVHKKLFGLNRGIYAAALALPGSTDFSKEIGVEALLSIKNGREDSILQLDVETNILIYLLTQLKANKLINLFLKLKEDKINNARTKRIILSVILNHPNFEYWAVKYRRKLADVLEHAWNKKTTSTIQAILAKKTLVEKERLILSKNIGHYLFDFSSQAKVHEIVRFVLGDTSGEITLPILSAFKESKSDINKGTALPHEVLEGIRSTYHKSVTSARVLELTKENLTSRETMKIQKNAASKGVEIKFDPMKQDMVDLYIHAYANNKLEADVEKAIKIKAKGAAKSLNFGYDKIGIVFDASKSSFGDTAQKMRPIAIQSALAQMLMSTANKHIIEFCGGYSDGGLIYPKGETNLSNALVKVMKGNPDAIFILSDGYENAPAGRVNEVMEAFLKLGLNIPVYQVSPVTSAVTQGVKKLSDRISTIPANNPNAIGSGILKALIEQDLENGLKHLLKSTVLLLNKKNK